jgi:FkbM family methyltransferase
MISNQIQTLKPKYEKIEENIHNGIVLWGAGQYGQISLEYLQKNNYKVSHFIDVSPQKQGTVINGITVIPPPHNCGDVILITARHVARKIERDFDGTTPIMSFDVWFVIKHIDKFKVIREMFNDSRSRDVLDNILMAILTDDKNEFYTLAYDDNQYFCLPGFNNGMSEYFVDVGAYVGDSLEKFIWAQAGIFSHIYAFEPGKLQFSALQKRTKRLIEEWAIAPEKITLIEGGISNKTQKVFVPTQETTVPASWTLLNTSLVNETNMSDCICTYSLDDYFQHIPISFIKADIEGYEMKLLEGATKVIVQNKPKLALCTYHGASDIFDFMDLLTEIVPEYKFSLRHHSYSLLETVLYCYI